MNFDFTNYTFSGILSIVAALYGIAYPIILQNIEKLYSQYNTDAVANWFTKEYNYRAFQVVLFVNMAAAVFSPFLLQTYISNQVTITIQMALLVALITQTYLLYQLILQYSNPNRLIYRLSNKKTLDIESAIDIAEYADSKHSISLYLKAMTAVAHFIHEQQSKQQTKDIKIPVVYDNTIRLAAIRLKHYIERHEQFKYLGSNADLVASLYCTLSDTRISLDTHKTVWNWVLTAIESNNSVWLHNYWQYANNYCSLVYRFPERDDARTLDKPLFQARHTMIGALMVYHKRYDDLNDLLFYTDSIPEYYGLVPSSFAEIIYMQERVHSLMEYPTFYRQQFCFRSGFDIGMHGEEFVEQQVNKYLALLTIRLWSLQGQRTDYTNNLFEIPLPPKLIDENYEQIKVLNIIKEEIHKWYDKRVFDLIPNLVAVEEPTVVSLVDKYININNKAIIQNQTKPEVNSVKYAKLADGINVASKEFCNGLPMQNEKKSGVIYNVNDVETSITLHTSYYSDNVNIDVHTLPESLFAQLRFCIESHYLQILKRIPKAWKTKVHISKLDTFFTQLKINKENYALINLSKVHSISSYFAQDKIFECKYLYLEAFIIVPVEAIPFVCLEKPYSIPSEYSELHPESTIYSNIDGFKLKNEPEYELCMKTQVAISEQCMLYKAIEVHIDYEWQTSNEKIELLKTIDGII